MKLNLIVLLSMLLSTYSFSQDIKTVHIDSSVFKGNYPAVILDIPSGELVSLNDGKSEAALFKGIAVENGLFIEPQDPEIGAINLLTEEDYPKIILLDNDFNSIVWDDLSGEKIAADRMFLVATSNRDIYKFKIVRIEKASQTMVLEYQKL